MVDAIDDNVKSGVWQQERESFRSSWDDKDVVITAFDISQRFRLTLATFGNRQGPVVAAARTAHLLSTAKLTHLGMVGICGGRRLGDVIVALQAEDTLGGHVTTRGSNVEAT